MKKYRNNKAIGALLDEYEKAIHELLLIIKEITEEELVKVIDKETKDPDCMSIQTILTHVIRAGYGYVIEIRNYLGEELEFRKEIPLNSIGEYKVALIQMFEYNEKLFEQYPNLVIEEMDYDRKIHAKWGQHYDVEQLLEHAIVHVLRHRRQIEKMMDKTSKVATLEN